MVVTVLILKVKMEMILTSLNLILKNLINCFSIQHNLKVLWKIMMNCVNSMNVHTPSQLKSDLCTHSNTFTISNVNIRSTSKNFDKLKECIKTVNHDFTVIGVTENHLQCQPHEYFNLPGYELEYVNIVLRNKGGVCIY